MKNFLYKIAYKILGGQQSKKTHKISYTSDSRHSQVAIYTVFDEESEFQVKNKQILDPGGKI